MTRIIAIANQKGGVGKTTTCTTLAHGLARAGKQVLIIDCDPQGQSASALGIPRDDGVFNLLVNNLPLAEAARSAVRNGYERPGLYIVPGNKRTATAQVDLILDGAPIDRFQKLLRGTKMDYVVFDTSPSVGTLQETALYASDWLIAPTSADYLSSEGLEAILNTLKVVQARGSRCELFGVLLTMYDEVTRESRATREQLEKYFPGKLLTPIHRATALRDSTAEGRTVWEAAPNSRAAEEYAALVQRVLEHE